MPEKGAPFAFILYADKTHLSSAGTVKAYPVIARCGNLPVNIRNSNGPGGGCLVGWFFFFFLKKKNPSLLSFKAIGPMLDSPIVHVDVYMYFSFVVINSHMYSLSEDSKYKGRLR